MILRLYQSLLLVLFLSVASANASTCDGKLQAFDSHFKAPAFWNFLSGRVHPEVLDKRIVAIYNTITPEGPATLILIQNNAFSLEEALKLEGFLGFVARQDLKAYFNHPNRAYNLKFKVSDIDFGILVKGNASYKLPD